MYVSDHALEDFRVVPYVGTWIEMCHPIQPGREHDVVPYVGTWIEIITCFHRSRRRFCRSLRGNVDRNYHGTGYHASADSRSLRGNVDRNSKNADEVSRPLKSFPTWERG